MAHGWSTEGPFPRGYLTSDLACTCLYHEQLGREEGENQPQNLNLEKLWCLASHAFTHFSIKVKLRKSFLCNYT